MPAPALARITAALLTATGDERTALLAERATALTEILAAHRRWRRNEPDGSRANLARADLADANLADADLADANLAGAYLAGADLAGANLADANLARADLADANLADAYLAGANLARADLTGAYLAGAPSKPYQRGVPTPERLAERAKRYREIHPDVPVVEQIDARILESVTTGGGSLEMGGWHTCDTTHCRAGWAIHLAGAPGYELERKLGPHGAGRAIYRASTGRSPYFFASNEAAMADIRRCAGAAS